MRLRVSIVGVLWWIFVAAVGLAALANASRGWYGVMFLVYLGSVAYATVGAALLSGDGRRYWAGYAVFGWIFYYACFLEPTDRMVGNPVVNLALDLTDWLLERIRPELYAAGEARAAVARAVPTVLEAQLYELHFEKVVQTLIGMGFATAGALACRYLLGAAVTAGRPAGPRET